MNVALSFFLILLIYSLIGFLIYKGLKRFSRYLATRIVLPSSNVFEFLKEVDNEKEKKTRKAWLLSFILLTITSTTYSFFSLYLSGLINFYLSLLIAILSPLIGVYATYYCAYHKKGTALLLYILIMLPITISFALLPKELLSFSLIKNSLPRYVDYLNYLMYIPFWINCLRLRSINLQRRYQKNALILQTQFKESATT